MIVALSGGVDSSVAALLLKEKGYEVVGVTMKLECDGNHPNDPTSPKKRGELEEVASRLGIPFFEIDFSHRFQDKVLAPFVSEYLQGYTPNPCVECNRYLKFGAFIEEAFKMGADFVATGHYVRNSFDPKQGRFRLRKAIHLEKDQSYVLYPIPSFLLPKLLFPMGDLPSKAMARQKAKEWGFPNASNPESQDICFIPNGDYRSFLFKQTGKRFLPGNIVDTSGRILGKHEGLPLYTVGQRKGLKIAFSSPLYVISLNVKDNELVVGKKEEALYWGIEVGRLNWTDGIPQSFPLHASVKVRYRSNEISALIEPLSPDTVRVCFESPQFAPAPGQSAVFYDREVVLGGGIILKSLK